MGRLFGFNPTPSISLGDTERVIEIHNETISSRRQEDRTPKSSIGDIVDKFILEANSLGMSNSRDTQSNVIVTDKPINVTSSEVVDLERQLEESRKLKELELARIKREIEEERAETERLLKQREESRAESARLLKLQEEENRRAAEQLEQQRAEAERLRKLQEEETKRMQAERERQLADRERQLAEQERAMQERLRRAAIEEQERLTQIREQARLEAEAAEKARIKAEADRKDREEAAAKERALEEARARANAEAAEKAKIKAEEEAKAKADAEKRQKLEQLRKLKKQQQMAKTVAKPKINTPSNNDYYNALDINTLFKEVKAYAISLGISKQIIDRKTLDAKFGKPNINKLILKSYLISIGKGVTFGNG